MIVRVSLAVAVLSACTGGSETPIDATPDSPPVPVVALSSCPAIVDATIIDTPTAFIPKVTETRVGVIVKFSITAEHFVMPNTLTTTDPALMVSRGQTQCFKFNVAGSYGFLCGVHGFTGTITVN
jgi:plastocyanin